MDYRKNVRAAALVLGPRDGGMSRQELFRFVHTVTRGQCDSNKLVAAVNELFVELTPGRKAKRIARLESMRMP